ncbi:MAG: hypothetical protein QG640_215, partial [Patescibacteria group bacterium]|nr:hypothetical protein [Patescibacteria group bacterium]
MLILNKRDSLFWKFVEYVFYVFVVLFPLVTYKSFLFGGTSSRSANLILLSIVLGIGYAIWLFKKGNSLHISKSFIPLSISIYFLFLVVSGLIGQNFSIS